MGTLDIAALVQLYGYPHGAFYAGNGLQMNLLPAQEALLLLDIGADARPRRHRGVYGAFIFCKTLSRNSAIMAGGGGQPGNVKSTFT